MVGTADRGLDAKSGGAELEKSRLERELYLRLLELGTQTDLEPFLEEELALFVEIAGAEQGYLELHCASDDVEHGWSIAHGFSDPEIDWVSPGRSLGVPSVRAEAADELTPELARAIAEPGPHLIEMVLWRGRRPSAEAAGPAPPG